MAFFFLHGAFTRKAIYSGNRRAVVTVDAATCTVARAETLAKEALAAAMAAGVATAFPAVDPSAAPTIGFHPKALKVR